MRPKSRLYKDALRRRLAQPRESELPCRRPSAVGRVHPAAARHPVRTERPSHTRDSHHCPRAAHELEAHGARAPKEGRIGQQQHERGRQQHCYVVADLVSSQHKLVLEDGHVEPMLQVLLAAAVAPVSKMPL